MNPEPDAGSPLNLPARDLEALADLLAALVPGKIVDAAPPGWSQGWQACCAAIRTVASAKGSS